MIYKSFSVNSEYAKEDSICEYEKCVLIWLVIRSKWAASNERIWLAIKSKWATDNVDIWLATMS